MEQDIKNAIQYVNEIYHQNFENEDQLEDILYQYLVDGNEEFIDRVCEWLSPEVGLFFITMIKDMASIKGYVINGKSFISHLYTIPFIAIQDKNNQKRCFSDSDISALHSLFKKHGVSDKYDVAIFDTMLTPSGVPKEPVDINNAHDTIIFNSLTSPGKNNFSKGVSAFGEIIEEDKNIFNVDDITLVLRYISISIREDDVGIQGGDKEETIDEFVHKIKPELFCEELKEILSNYYKDILMAFTPIPHVDGVDIGIIEYHSMVTLKTFLPVIDAFGASNVDIFIDNSRIGTLQIMLVNKIDNTILAEYDWSLPILSDATIGHHIEYFQDLCYEMGLSGYKVERREKFSQASIH